MMLDICGANTAALLTSLDAYIETLRSLRARIANEDVTLEDTFGQRQTEHETAGYERAAIQVILNQTHDADDARGKRSSRGVCDRQRMNRVSTSAGISPCYTGVAVIY